MPLAGVPSTLTVIFKDSSKHTLAAFASTPPISREATPVTNFLKIGGKP
jgi:hypothetical protein